jgi:hypothetical protein
MECAIKSIKNMNKFVNENKNIVYNHGIEQLDI